MKLIGAGAVAALTVSFIANLANAGVVNVSYSSPSLDRWFYPFNFAAGTESSAPTFGAILVDGFDDRDSQFIIGFNTSTEVQPGLPRAAYKIRAARVRVSVSADNQARYDTTPISYQSLLPDTDPDYIPDPTVGKPTELFGVSFRNGISNATFAEDTPNFNGNPNGESLRSANDADIDTSLIPTDVSNQITNRFNAQPFAIGTTSTVNPGDLMPAATELTFDIDLCASGAKAYFQQSLRDGRILLNISSLEPAAGGPGGGTGDPTYPAFYTKENATAAAINALPKLQLTVQVGPISDMNADDGVTIDDLLDFLEAFSSGSLDADLNSDCGITIDDLLDYLDAFQQGL